MATKYNQKKFLSAFKVEDKMDMGSFLLCDEPHTIDHENKHKCIWFLVIDMDD